MPTRAKTKQAGISEDTFQLKIIEDVNLRETIKEDTKKRDAIKKIVKENVIIYGSEKDGSVIYSGNRGEKIIIASITQRLTSLVVPQAPDILKRDKFGKRYVTTKKQEIDVVDWEQLENDIKLEQVPVELIEKLYQIKKTEVLNTDIK